MPKIGTAHIEVKPVLNEEALEAISAAIEEAVVRGLLRVLNPVHQTRHGDPAGRLREEVESILHDAGHRIQAGA